jgi:hypothetical protein
MGGHVNVIAGLSGERLGLLLSFICWMHLRLRRQPFAWLRLRRGLVRVHCGDHYSRQHRYLKRGVTTMTDRRGDNDGILCVTVNDLFGLPSVWSD